jgi:putative transposase
LNTELDEHLDGDGVEGKTNYRNGYSKKSVLTGTSKMTLSVPRIGHVRPEADCQIPAEVS